MDRGLLWDFWLSKDVIWGSFTYLIVECMGVSFKQLHVLLAISKHSLECLIDLVLDVRLVSLTKVRFHVFELVLDLVEICRQQGYPVVINAILVFPIELGYESTI